MIFQDILGDYNRNGERLLSLDQELKDLKINYTES